MVFETGDNSPVTGIYPHAGRLMIFKRDAVFAVLVHPTATVQETVSTGVGCVAQNSINQIDDRLYFMDTRGVQMMLPYGDPVRVSEMIEEFIDYGADRLDITRTHSAVNRRRGQYVFTMKEASSNYRDVRYAAERVGETEHRFTPFRGPNLTALATMWDRLGDDHAFVGGTEEGFCVWLDRRDTALAMLGDVEGAWGASSVTVGAGAAPPIGTVAVSSGTVDTSLSGPRGAVLRWLSGSTEITAVILGVSSDGATLFVDRGGHWHHRRHAALLSLQVVRPGPARAGQAEPGAGPDAPGRGVGHPHGRCLPELLRHAA
jgi:hypothetical protein